MTHEEALEVIDTLREVMRMKPLPIEPLNEAGSIEKKALRALSSAGGEVRLIEISARIGHVDRSSLCRLLRKMSGKGLVERGEGWGTWKIAEGVRA